MCWLVCLVPGDFFLELIDEALEWLHGDFAKVLVFGVVATQSLIVFLQLGKLPAGVQFDFPIGSSDYLNLFPY